MGDPIIKATNVGKRFLLGAGTGHNTLRDQLTEGFRRLLRREKREEKVSEHWALRGVSFEVNEGDVLGIIGHNGAGKSTLLKLLCQISEPTEGEIRMRGRVASLLEVGTGFHPELTGRENVYLNGAILGMARAEIRKKFDEIVEFAEVEKFIDTPVKRYSSGMYVRLAFAVAAHLESEILIVDEVLAVGDAAFQRKCLGKMGDAASAGRTVLFVSHNMATLSALCSTGLWLNKGMVRGAGTIRECVDAYMAATPYDDHAFKTDGRTGTGRARITHMKVTSADLEGKMMQGSAWQITMSYEAEREGMSLRFMLGIFDRAQQRLLALDSHVAQEMPEALPKTGTIVVDMPADYALAAGHYSINVAVQYSGENADFIRGALQFSVEEGDLYSHGRRPYGVGMFLVKHSWKIK